MTAVLFVHGTGVRQLPYAETFAQIKRSLHARRPDVNLIPCLWGESLGAKLNAEGASIPLYDTTRGEGRSN